MTLNNKINAFLHYGYVPRLPEGLANVMAAGARSAPTKYSAKSGGMEELVQTGWQCLINSCSFDAKKKQIVPLSGGIDSRLVLGALLQLGLRDQITAVTYGLPGTADFELAKQVAQTAGVLHHSLELSGASLSDEMIRKVTAKRGGWTFLYDSVFNQLVFDRYGDSVTYWSGFMGDNLAGSHLPEQPSSSWQKAVDYFAGWNRFVGSASLIQPGFSPADALPSEPVRSMDGVCFDDQLDTIRQGSYIQRVLIDPGVEIKVPFLDPSWVSFILSLPHDMRFGMRFYRRMAVSSLPELFRIPVATGLGLRLGANSLEVGFKKLVRRLSGGVPPSVFHRWLSMYPKENYINFSAAALNGPFHDLLVERLESLQRRGVVPWIDLERLWREHAKGIRDHGRALSLLGALEWSIAADQVTAPT